MTGGLLILAGGLAAAASGLGHTSGDLPGLAALFLNPVKLPHGWHLWMLFPLVGCVAVVYRATRARSPAEMPRATVITFVSIIVGMFAIAVAFYAAHRLVQG